MGRKVAIVARAPASRYLAPFADTDVEIWTLSPGREEDGFTDLPRWDRWYEFHDEPYLNKENPGYLGWLAKQDQEKVWGRERFPIDDIVEALGKDYFTSSVAYMIAHAVYEGVDWLGVYGVDMAHATEYGRQRPCCEYWLGYARGRGVEVYTPLECDLSMHRQRYALTPPSPLITRLAAREAELENNLKAIDGDIRENQSKTAAAIGGMQELKELVASLNGEASAELIEAIEKRSRAYEDAVARNYEENRSLNTTRDMYLGALEEHRYQGQFV